MVIDAALACGWALLALAAMRAVSRRRATRARAAALGPERTARPARVGRATRFGFGRGHLVERLVADQRARRSERRDLTEYARQLGPSIDLVAVAIGAGATPFQAIELAARVVAEPAGLALQRVADHVRLGVALPDALASVARTAVPLRPLTEALAAAHRLGSPLGELLARLAADARASERRRAEATARAVPVRLLFPLVFCVLPAFAVLTVVPVVIAGWHQL